jgi:hypothetical protein
MWLKALKWTREVMAKIGLTLNEAKAKIKQARAEQFHFSGLHFWAALLSEGRSLVFRSWSIEEERGSIPAQGGRAAEARQPRTV